jgi:phage tail-like protein
MWSRCDHAATRIEGTPARVTLATAASVAADSAAPDLAAWRAAMGSVARLACPPDFCEGEATVLADPARGLLVLRDSAWAALALPERPAPAAPPLDFAPAMPPPPAAPPRGIARDPKGRAWLLDAAPPALRLLGADLRLAARVPLPADARPFALGCARWGVVVADATRLFLQAWGGTWIGVALPGAPLALAADPRFATVVVVLEGQRIAVLDGPRAPAIHPLPALRHPLHAAMLGADRVLVADVAGAPGAALPTRFTEFLLRADGPEAERGFAMRGFDGRALWLDAQDRAWASTATGARRLYAEEPRYATEGVVETFALDSGVFACVWHRLFLDACVPPGTEISVEARTADTLPPRELRRAPRPPADRTAPLPEDQAWPPLGTLAPAEAIGWAPLGLLDARPAFADTPDPPFARALPSEDPYREARGEAVAPPEAMVTLEGVIKAPPGRWLFLRITLRGTARRAPSVFALRATCPRPSLLDRLPAYWRGDPAAADATDRALALFEGFTTETAQRIAALRLLLGASTAPREALDWLAGFVALTFDARVAEDVRRSLLAEAATLWRRRGTLPGLARLLSILARAPVQIIEGFRLRRSTVATLGQAQLGHALQMGDGDTDEEAGEAWEQALALRHAALLLRRAAARAEGDTPCPADDPPAPLDPDPLIRFHRRFAHRFTVLVPAHRCDDLEAVLELATETHKPAHTIHAFCWLDAGFRLGAGSLVGLSRIGPRDSFAPGVIGRATLGARHTISRATAEDRFRLGATRLAQHGTLPP